MECVSAKLLKELELVFKFCSLCKFLTFPKTRIFGCELKLPCHLSGELYTYCDDEVFLKDRDDTFTLLK